MQDRKGWQPKSPVALVRDHVVGENALEALTPSEEHLNGVDLEVSFAHIGSTIQFPIYKQAT